MTTTIDAVYQAALALPESQRADLVQRLMRSLPATPSKVASVEAELDQLAALSAGWDGYGAPAIDAEIVAAARIFLRALPASLASPPRAVPLSSGSVQFEWHGHTKVLELEFENSHTLHFLQWNPPEGVEVEDTFPASDIDRAAALIEWVTERGFA